MDCDTEQQGGFLLLLAMCFVIGTVSLNFPEAKEVCTKQEYIWPKPRDDQGRWPGFERWGGCND